MKKSSKIEEALAELNRATRGDWSVESYGHVRHALASQTSLLVARAATIAANKGLPDLAPDLVAAYSRFIQDGAKTDKGCQAKTAIVHALDRLEHFDEGIAQHGAYYVQMEPAFGGPEDTAIAVRSACAFALARADHPDAHYVLTDLLVDKDRQVRAAAVKALTYLATPEGELALRLKVLTGDKEIEVTAECFAGLIAMAPTRSLPFVARYLAFDHTAELESAALAIGGARTAEALATLLRAWYEMPVPSIQRALLLPIALVRSDEAFGHLLTVLKTADCKTALEAVRALALYPAEAYVAHVRAAAAARKEPEIRARVDQEFA